MRYNKIIWGIILILLGILLILRNLGIVFFSWHIFWKLWPFIFIFWGIKALPIKEYIKFVLAVITLACAIYLLQTGESRVRWGDSDEQDYKTTYKMDEQTLKEAYDSNVSSATLKLNAAAGDFSIKDVTDQLILFNKKGNIGDYNMSINKQSDGSKIISIELKNHHIDLTDKGNNVNIKLNPNPIWDMDFDIGAAKTDFDLSQYRTKTIKINGGAADINLKLGDNFYRTQVETNTGAASINIKIPKSSGSEIISNTFLVDKEIEGFKKTKENTYTTDNFKYSSNKIFIKVDAALSNFKVERY